jgi:hypothetical protein
LKSGGRLALADIVTEVLLWAALIGGAMQQDDYRSAIEAAVLRIRTVRGQSKLSVHPPITRAGGLAVRSRAFRNRERPRIRRR